jgi:RNA polymerase sigma-70 factor (ECF subfamily)
MTEEHRIVFVLFELEQLTTPEIATMLGVPVGTVASRLRRAREIFLSRAERGRGER